MYFDCWLFLRLPRYIDNINALTIIKIFYKEIKSYQSQVENWNIKKTERALDILVEADLKTKEFSELGSSIIGDIVLRLSNVARK